MINPNDFRNDYEPVYGYTSAPIMPGIRHLSGVPEEHHKVLVDLEAVNDNFMPNHMPNFNDQRILVPVVMAAGGSGLEGFGNVNMRFFLRLFIFALIVALIFYLIKKN